MVCSSACNCIMVLQYPTCVAERDYVIVEVIPRQLLLSCFSPLDVQIFVDASPRRIYLLSNLEGEKRLELGDWENRDLNIANACPEVHR